jgi:glycosyltransferase involved in cell wall biosynthesis
LKDFRDNTERNQVIVSFIIPTLNVEEYLPQCLGAIQRQATSEGKLEIIVVDNGSTDKSIQYAQEYGATVYSAPGKTVAAVRNIGAAHSRGLFLAFVDADCVIGDQWLENGLKHFNDPQVSAAGAPTTITENATWVGRYWFLNNQGKRGKKKTAWLPSANMIVRSSAFDEIGGFNEALITCEDSDIGYRLSYKYIIISDPLIVSIHLREPKTVRQFYEKEKWRGQGNFQGLLAHGIVWDDVPSLLFPLYYLLVFLLTPFLVGWSLLSKGMGPAAVSILLILGPIVLLSLQTTIRHRRWKAFFPLCLLYLAYALARARAILPRRNTVI